LRDGALADWIAMNVAFPATMVDRIVPAMTPADQEDARAATGLTDAAPVSHEPFRQWVIEDRFGSSERPAWEAAGAQIVADVAPFEHMKLRLLNGAHSALAYLGYLAGCETIFDAVSDPVLNRFVRRLWDEIIPMVPLPPDTDLRRYTEDLLVRFANPTVRHRTWQIAMDGSQKLPQRLLGTIRERLHAGLPIPSLALAVAAWIRYVGGVDEAGRPIDVRDPLAVQLRALASGADAVGNVLAMQDVFGADLPGNPVFVTAVTEAYHRLRNDGVLVAAQ
jgi:fructuronate reductase